MIGPTNDERDDRARPEESTRGDSEDSKSTIHRPSPEERAETGIKETEEEREAREAEEEIEREYPRLSYDELWCEGAGVGGYKPGSTIRIMCIGPDCARFVRKDKKDPSAGICYKLHDLEIRAALSNNLAQILMLMATGGGGKIVVPQ